MTESPCISSVVILFAFSFQFLTFFSDIRLTNPDILPDIKKAGYPAGYLVHPPKIIVLKCLK